jgi:hypothetical protein
MATLGFLTLVLHFASAGTPPWPHQIPSPRLGPLVLPVSSALLLGFGGAGLVGLGLPRRTDRGRLAAGAFGAIEVVLCLGILAARIVWRADVEGGLLVDSSLQLLFATLGLGICLAATTWIRNPATVAAPWLPLSVGVASIVTVVLLWRAFISYERERSGS